MQVRCLCCLLLRSFSAKSAVLMLLTTCITAVDKFESKSKLTQGVGRAAYYPLHVVYYCRPSKPNLLRILADYSQPVEDDADCFEKLFPCIFKGISLTVPPPMYNRASLIITAARAGQGSDNAELAAGELLSRCRNSPEHQRFEDYFNPHPVIPVRTSYSPICCRSLLPSSASAGGAAPCCPRCALAHLLRHPPAPLFPAAQESIVEFFPLDTNMFSLEMPDAVKDLYSAASVAGSPAAIRDIRELLDLVAFRLSTVCISMNERPYIRYHQPRHEDGERSGRSYPFTLSTFLEAHLAAYAQAHPEWAPTGHKKATAGTDAHKAQKGNMPQEPATVLVLDRVSDLASVMIHDLGYQSLMGDLLNWIPGMVRSAPACCQHAHPPTHTHFAAQGGP